MSLSSATPTTGQLNILKYKLAKFDIEGNFISFDDLSTQLMICSQSLQDGVDFRRFGITISTSCTFDLTTLINSNPPSTTNMFFELFV